MVLVVVEHQNAQIKKAGFEVVTFGRHIANKMNTTCEAVVFGKVDQVAQLGIYGAEKVHVVDDDKVSSFDSQVYTSALSQLVERTNAEVVVLSHSSMGKSVLGRLSIKLSAAAVSAVGFIPETEGGFQVKKAVFAGKAYATYRMNTPIKLISLIGNSLPPEKLGAPCDVVAAEVSLSDPRVKVLDVQRSTSGVPLPEAERVVSAGRGMKDPANWTIIEELASELDAATACSRPVADSGWRPHHEHVGQTGLAIQPNLYVAIGISGAIQHLAGVNNSKVIVVINKDIEAPFFKAADYGVCGDLFEVVPRLISSLKKFKSGQ